MRIHCILGTLLLPALAWAVEPPERAAEPNKPQVFVGLGALVTSEPYRGIAARVYPVPLFGYESQGLYLHGLSGGYRLIRGEGWSLGPIVQPRFECYRSTDSSALTGMEDRGITLEAGLGFSWRAKWGQIGASWVADILGKHNGCETELAYSLMLPWAGFDLVPSCGIRCKSNHLTDYYYGVRPEEATPTRPSYKPGSAIDPFVRLVLKRPLTETLSAVGAVQCEWFDGGVRDSPIVDKGRGTSLLIGLLYAF